MMLLAQSGGILLAIAFVFYDSPIALLLLLPLMIPVCLRRKRVEEEHRKARLIREFKECIGAVVTAMKAGSSAENAFRGAEEEMACFYGDRSAICQELALLTRGLDSNVPLETLLEEFARRSGAEEIQDFAGVFSVAKRSGGNMTEILMRTVSQIQSRIEVEQEIGVVISSSRLEQSIMDVVPFGIIVYIRLTSGDFMDVLYHNPAGIAVMTGCLIVYMTAFLMSEKIAAIHV